jgi:hypothetical protein
MIYLLINYLVWVERCVHCADPALLFYQAIAELHSAGEPHMLRRLVYIDFELKPGNVNSI